jgi:16S rRNA (adenine1518-N6/adenine1519-N6)-dimethyltransferase
MDLSLTLPPLDIPALLRQHGLHPDKRLGQNFLIDNASLLKIIQAAELQPGDLVLEIGAGLGNLTRQLAIRSQRVVAVELDHRLMPALRQVLTPFQNVTIVQGDILSIPAFELLQSFVGNSYQVVANIPYYITSAVIRRLLESTPPPIRICLTVQLEVAERICADPGELSLLALSVQLYGFPHIAARIPAVVRVDIYPQSLIPTSRVDTFFLLAKAGFGQKRKTLRNALVNGLHLPPAQIETLLSSANIDPKRRAETLSLSEWKLLVECYLTCCQ